MSATRKERRAVRAAKADYLRNHETGRAMLDHAVVWLGTLSGFESTPVAIREAVVIELRSRDRCEFEAFKDAFGLPGIRLVDQNKRPLPLATLYATKLKCKLKGTISNGRDNG